MIKTLCFFVLLAGMAGCSKSNNGYVNNPGSSYPYNKPVGYSARDLLSSAKYTSVKIEVMYMPGYAPDAAALSHCEQFLSAAMNKNGGVTIITRQIPTAGTGMLSVDQVAQIERNNRQVFTQGTTLALSVIYTDGAFTDGSVLGAAYLNTSVVLFGKVIADNSGAIGQASRTKLVATVLEHEMGHLLGLVDLGSPLQTPHKDATHGNHCTNSNCLMYYASDTNDILGFLITGNIPLLDQACKDDLLANGGR
ncbi:MAG: hypothetical protein IPP93_06605 [Chitinophagaceae bacterium]|nr:hypothetical protein [Chitinophagaceae bacterium]